MTLTSDSESSLDLRSEPAAPEPSLCLVVPVYNEERRIRDTVGQLIDFISTCPAGSHLVFVDDGSTDATVEVIRSAIDRKAASDVQVLCRGHAGKGAAVRAGLNESRADVAAFCDVDLATPLDEVKRLCGLAWKSAGLVVGSRATESSQLERREARRREIAGKAYNKVVRLWLCPGVADTQCGAKAAPTAVWRTILPHSLEDGFAWDVETIALASRLIGSVQEVGVRWKHDDRTTVRVARDGTAMVTALPRIGWHVRLATRRAGRVPAVRTINAVG